MSLPSGRLTQDDAAGECGDVIGTSIGGATFGYAMARAGQQVLFCERGDSHMDQDGGGGNSKALTGHYPEQDLPAAIARHLALDRGLLRHAGRASALLDDVFGRKTRSFMLFWGSGTGGRGASALYGMAMERLFPVDFEPRQQHPGDSDNSLPAGWPPIYADLTPWYTPAEALYRVRGSVDPLRAEFDGPRSLPAPPALTPADGLPQSRNSAGNHALPRPAARPGAAIRGPTVRCKQRPISPPATCNTMTEPKRFDHHDALSCDFGRLAEHERAIRLRSVTLDSA